MQHLQEITTQRGHPALVVDKDAFHSPYDGKPYSNGDTIAQSAFDRLLGKNPAFYWTVSRHLADILDRMHVPQSLIEDVVQEAWLSAIEHLNRFAEAITERRLLCWLRKVVHDKAVDLFRHLDYCPCESLDAEGIEPIDESEANRAETSEQREMLDALLEEVRPDHEENMLLLRLHYFQEFSIHELAQRFGMTPKAVDNRIRRALIELRELAHLTVQRGFR